LCHGYINSNENPTVICFATTHAHEAGCATSRNSTNSELGRSDKHITLPQSLSLRIAKTIIDHRHPDQILIVPTSDNPRQLPGSITVTLSTMEDSHLTIHRVLTVFEPIQAAQIISEARTVSMWIFNQNRQCSKSFLDSS
jgi:hypothetical protein